MKKQNSERDFSKLGDYFKCNFFKFNKRVNNRYNSINVYKNKKFELLIRKRKTKKKTQNIFELVNFRELLLYYYINYKKYKLIYNKSKENKDKGEIIKYVNLHDEVLGKGAFGECFKMRAMDKEDMNFYAGKIILKEKVSNNRKSLLDEIKIQMEFKDNPKIVRVKDYFEDEDNVYIILELCKNKSLADYLAESKEGKLTEIEVKCFIFQLLQGLKYLHNKKIIHRDLKPNNLLLGDKNELKIGDFGLVVKINQDKERKNTVCGTIYYMAPEIFENNGKGYSFEVDIWSVGIIMYQLLTGKLPFTGENSVEIQKKILDFQPEKLDVNGLTNVAADLIKQILVKDPKKRPGINQIIYHYFFHDTFFPKYITHERADKIKIERNKEEEEEKKKLKMKLYSLIVDDIPEIKYENIKNYIIKESVSVYKQYITYYHKSANHGVSYFEFNNEIIGIIEMNKNDRSFDINIIYNTETKIFYVININEDNEDDDEIKGYIKEEVPEELKKKIDILLKYYQLRLKQTNKEEKSSIKEQNSFSQSSKKSGQNSLSNENSIISQKRILDKSNFIYIRKIIVHKLVTVLFLSNQTKEAVFTDKIKILLSELKNKIELIDRDNKINVVSTNNAFNNSNSDFAERLKLIKSVMFRDIKNKFSNKNNKKNDVQ